MELRKLLEKIVQQQASDLYLTVDSPPMCRIYGVVQPIMDGLLTNEEIESLAQSIMRERQWSDFQTTMEMNLALHYPESGRFRVNVFRQRGNAGIIIRHIKMDILTVEQLRLPPVLNDIAMSKRGLVLVVGATGSGKSTSLAAMIDYRNSNSQGHIISVEDPIE
ncbi:MAG: Flp pilus assembly complex ATPase component TadA, partial [Deltaproteobacteria bacterium]|nr:Flp pilus assembly complex ATPase component TadA [Deltaproteobacteria bacterium]